MERVGKLAAILGLGAAAGWLLSYAEQNADGESDATSHYRKRRDWMVKSQLVARGIKNERVLQAMREVPRHLFVPAHMAEMACDDRALSIGEGQTISQPYIVALMTELANPQPTDVALDIGTGSGYQAAILSRLVKRVDSIEIVPRLAETARRLLSQLECSNVEVHLGDGTNGLPQGAPFDIITLAAAPKRVPPALIEQLALNGRLVLPVGEERGEQKLVLLRKSLDGIVTTQEVAPVAFVPMTGEAQRNHQS